MVSRTLRRARPHRPAARMRCGVATAACMLATTTASVLLTGCMVGPDYDRPDLATDDAWLEADDPALRSEDANFTAWWTLFEDPVLDALVEQAVAQNLTLRTAGIRVLVAMAQRGIAIGQLYPQTQVLGGAYNREYASENLEQGGLPAVESRTWNEWSTTFDASWEIDFWGKFRRNIESADASLDASVADYDAVMVSLVAEVAGTYIDLRTLQERLRLAEQNAALQRESLELTRVKFTNGAVSELDVTQAESNLYETIADIPVLAQNVQQTKNALAYLLSMTPGSVGAMVDAPAAIPVPPTVLAVGIPSDLLRRRPDIRAAERSAAAQAAQIGVAEAQLYPAFSLSGAIGFEANTLSSLFSSGGLAGTIGAGFSWPIFNYGRLQNNVRVQDATFQVLLVQYQDSVLNAAREVEDGLTSYLQARRQIDALSVSVVAARRSSELSRLQYAEGSSPFTRVLDSQVSLEQNEDELAVARGNSALAMVSTYKALGGGWEARTLQEMVPAETREEMSERTDWGDMLSDGTVPEEAPEAAGSGSP